MLSSLGVSQRNAMLMSVVKGLCLASVKRLEYAGRLLSDDNGNLLKSSMEERNGGHKT